MATNTNTSNPVVAAIKSLGYPDNSKVRAAHERIMYLGTGAVAAKNQLLWSGKILITLDGDTYRLRVENGRKLNDAADKAITSLTNTWWSPTYNCYFARSYNVEFAKLLRAMGWNGAKALTEDEVAAEQARTITPVAPPTTVAAVSSNGTQKAAMVSATDLPVGVKLNAKGRTVWASGDKEGLFVSKETLAELRKAQGITIVPAQQVEAQQVAKPIAIKTDSKPIVITTDTTSSDYEDGFMVGLADQVRGYDNNPLSDASAEWLRGYVDGWTPKPKVDPRVQALETQLAGTAQAMSNLGEMLGSMMAMLNEIKSSK